MASAAVHPGLRGRRAGAVALVALAILAYLPALRGGFVWDDDLTVTGNRLLQEPLARGLRELKMQLDQAQRAEAARRAQAAPAENQ